MGERRMLEDVREDRQNCVLWGADGPILLLYFSYLAGKVKNKDG